ncbi:MAG: hypothetical protein A2Z16_07385 [Chloroflexi bacterium RBG_16_54_18]|nr:MAG: hypothetical protein A2Z16_07385 [Chloroflexi bacterium RBG_16_54_18]
MKASYQVLVWGVYFCDLIYTDLVDFPRLGAEVYSKGFDFHPGGCFTTVLALQRLGVRAGWACDFGNDFFSSMVLEQARREGFDESLFRYHSQPVRRITSAISFPHDRAFLSFMDPVYPPDAAPILQQVQSEWLLLSHLYYGMECLPLFQAAGEAGMKIFMDCQSIDTSLDESAEIESALRLVEVFSPNEAEALRLTGEKDIDKALDRLAELTPIVVIKLGSGGALALSGGKRIYSPAITVARVVDTTGAGDCFDAGYLYAVLKGFGTGECLRIANICGGLSVQAAGGQGAPSEEQVLRWR